MARTGIMICGHGSRDPDAIREFERLIEKLAPRLPDVDLAGGYLEFARPIIREGLESLVEKGCSRILAIPGMLFAAGHVKNDLPWEINSFASDHPEIEMIMGRELAITPLLLKAANERIHAAEAHAHHDVAREDTCLVVVGRGTNDSDANSNVAKVARMLGEGMGFGWTEVAFSGVAHPRVDECLTRAVKLGFRRYLVFPYFLFTGVLVKRIYEQTAEVAAQFPQIEFMKAHYLDDHPLVIDAFLERIRETDQGIGAMNCQLCKYREQIIGYEKDKGSAQAGHHHHVRGIGTDEPHHHDSDHDHHGHDHHHPHEHAHEPHHSHQHGHFHRPSGRR
ncbi:MAG: sirohydrochlorin chelatase [Alphaproteobacteria bacterium]|nr:sirohydrochlorin chelatase [Alphaproteobacteria bacterium]